MHLKSRVRSSRWGLAAFIIITGALATRVASGAVTITGVTITPGPSPTACPQGMTGVCLTHGQSITLNATVQATGGTPNPNVFWTYTPTIDTLTPTLGPSTVFTARNTIFANNSSNTVTVTATSQQDPSKFAQITINLLPNIQVGLSPASVTLNDGGTQQFTATVTGTTNTAVNWSISPAGAGTIDANGFYTAPAPIFSGQIVTVTAKSIQDPTATATATVILVPLGTPPGVTVNPPTVTLKGGQTQQFSAQVVGLSSTQVTWSINPNVGSISSTGLYTAPFTIVNAQSVTVTATSVGVDSNGNKQTGAAVVTLTPPALSIVPTGVSLTAGQTQQFSAVIGSVPYPTVTWSSSPAGLGSIDPATGIYTAPAQINTRATVTIFAVSTVDNTQTASVTLTLLPTTEQTGVTVTPATASIKPGQTQQFTASVNGVVNAPVIWSISPQVGTISNTGVYSAPAPSDFTGNATITVTATSVSDPSLSGTATITLTALALVVTPASVTMGTNQQQQFTATLNGVPYTNVTWSLSAGWGSIDPVTGIYTSPSLAPVKITLAVIATDNNDATHFGQATITINQSVATITPSSVTLTLPPGANTAQFTFNIDGVADQNPAQDVVWTLSPNVGTISPAGLYTAPPAISTAQTVTLTGQSLIDLTKTAKATINLAVFVDVGHGAPNAAIQQDFITNFYRNGFYLQVSLPPLGDIKKLGTTGYVQEFQDASKPSGVKWALVRPNASLSLPVNGGPTVFQLNGDVYGYYTSVGVNTAGYPTMDWQNCPSFDANNSCTYDIFDKGVALFVYKLPVFASQTQFIISGVTYTKWNTLGGLNGLGRPTDTVSTVTSGTKVTANVQTYVGGGIYQITSGANNGKVFAVLNPTFALYQKQGGPTGYLGLPTADEVVLASGDHRQTFEGGAIQFTPGQTPAVRLPVSTISLGGASGTLHMNGGDTMSLTATPLTVSGAALTDRTVTWSTSNCQVVGIGTGCSATGSTVTIRAIAGGTALVRASADGVVSPALTITVTAQCCQVGEGAPTATISQAFQNAVTRDHLNVLLPAQNPVQRVGHGYVQQLQDAKTAAVYLLTKSDNSPAAYVVTGAILTRYQSTQLGGPAGSLGYPTGDASAGGTQVFENNAALAGTPVLLVAGAIYGKWASMGAEGGTAGPPTAEASGFKTIGANAGSQQSFANGVIYAVTSGPRTGQAYFVSGLILAAYSGIGGPGGAFGVPTSDEFVSGSTHRQNFEAGYIDYDVGAAAAQTHAATLKPAISAPQSVLAGSRAHLAITGFQSGATVRISVSGQPDFVVTAANGAYAWDIYVPLSAKDATIAIHAVDANGSDTADASYNVLSLAKYRAQMTKVGGDVQSGLPGALLPQPMQVVMLDRSGNPVIGAAVVFQASPGAQLVNAAAVTDGNGEAQAWLRMPAAEGLAAVTVDSPGIASAPVTFYASAASSSLSSYPRQMEAGTAAIGAGTATIAQKGALLAATSSILRYYQNRGDIGAPLGLADPMTLNAFLKTFCATDAQSRQICDGYLTNPDSGEQVVNLWRAGAFVSNQVDVSVEKTDLNSIRDLVAAGSPVLLSLSLSSGGITAGGHYVVAIGVGPDGEILIHDPNPALAQPQLDNYLSGFTASSGAAWTGQLLGAARLVVRTPAPTRFLLAAVSQPAAVLQGLTLEARSIVGACGQAVDFSDAADPSSALPAAAPRVSRFVACDGSQPVYQINVGEAQPFRAALTDLAAGGTTIDLSGSSTVSYKASRPAAVLALAPQDLALLNGVVNGATFTPGIAPGGLFAIFGSGLTDAGGANPAVTFNGEPAQVVSATPFQVIGQVPPDLDPGSYTVQVQSALGSASQQADVAANAPIILQASAALPTVVNSDNTPNAASAPAVRGKSVTILATGLGAVVPQGNASVAAAPVTVVVAGTEMPAASTVLAPKLVGVYQVSVTIPAGLAPGLELPMNLRQGGVDSNTVALSIQ